MNKSVFIVFYVFIFFSCQAQQKIVIFKNKDLILFENKKRSNIGLINIPEKHFIPDKNEFIYIASKVNDEIYNNNSYIIISQNWYGDGMSSERIEKIYSFVKDSDTMNIKCRCGQERNVYFKNFEFKKGDYELKLNGTQMEYVYGKQINTPNEVQNILFKDAFVNKEWKSKDLYFKDLKFVEIDLGDTANVKMTKLDKIE